MTGANLQRQTVPGQGAMAAAPSDLLHTPGFSSLSPFNIREADRIPTAKNQPHTKSRATASSDIILPIPPKIIAIFHHTFSVMEDFDSKEE